MSTAVTLADIYQRIKPEMRQVEEELRQLLDSRIPIIRDTSSYIVRSGGKRIRPALLLLITKLFNYSGPLAIICASVVEMIHTATLIHDDIVDEADLRRGQETVNRRWGNDVTVLLGDYLYIKAVSLALAQNNRRILEAISEATLKMVEGELIQMARTGKIDITEEDHLDIIQRKTAYLFAACCEIGAEISGASEEECQQLRAYGMDLGMSFQIVDDILDFTASQSVLGKPVVNDLKEGRLTLPLIYLLRKGDREHREAVARVLADKGFRSVSREKILEIVRSNGTIEETFDRARGYGASARRRLSSFRDGEIKEALLSLPTFILERDR